MIPGISSYRGYHNPSWDISIIQETVIIPWIQISYCGYQHHTVDISTLIGTLPTYQGTLYPKGLSHYEINYKY